MARKPSYKFERMQRERRKEERQQAKKERRAAARTTDDASSAVAGQNGEQEGEPGLAKVESASAEATDSAPVQTPESPSNERPVQ